MAMQIVTVQRLFWFCNDISIKIDLVNFWNIGIYSIHIQFPAKPVKIKRLKRINFKAEILWFF